MSEEKPVEPVTWKSPAELVSALRNTYQQIHKLTEELAAARRDCLTLCLRLYLEDVTSHAPETLEVLERWEPEIQKEIDRLQR